MSTSINSSQRRMQTFHQAKLNTGQIKVKSCLSGLETRLQSFDQFGQNFKMKIDEDKSELQSSMGTLLSLFMFVIVGMFAAQKAEIWLMKTRMDIAQATADSYFDDEDRFTHEDGINFAMAFTAYDSVEEPILDPTYGKIVFNAFGWGHTERYLAKRVKIKSHPCSREELGLDREHES